MATDRTILNKGISYLAWALPLFFIGPSLIYNAFINKDNGWHYLVLAFGIAGSFFALYFMFRGIATIMKSMFGS
jgi:hypothetical protein